MANLIHLEIVTPSKVFFDDEVKSLTAPGFEGAFQVLPRHAPYITTLLPGKVKILTRDDRELVYAISGGTVEVHANKITMLADTIVSREEIDVSLAQAERTEAENKLSAKEPGTDIEAVKHKLDVAKAMIKIAET